MVRKKGKIQVDEVAANRADAMFVSARAMMAGVSVTLDASVRVDSYGDDATLDGCINLLLRAKQELVEARALLDQAYKKEGR